MSLQRSLLEPFDLSNARMMFSNNLSAAGHYGQHVRTYSSLHNFHGNTRNHDRAIFFSYESRSNDRPKRFRRLQRAMSTFNTRSRTNNPRLAERGRLIYSPGNELIQRGDTIVMNAPTVFRYFLPPSRTALVALYLERA